MVGTFGGTSADMDVAAEEARQELDKMPQTETIPLARWWYRNVPGAGYKRLGKLLYAIGRDTISLPRDQWTTPDDVE